MKKIKKVLLLLIFPLLVIWVAPGYTNMNNVEGKTVKKEYTEETNIVRECPVSGIAKTIDSDMIVQEEPIAGVQTVISECPKSVNINIVSEDSIAGIDGIIDPSTIIDEDIITNDCIKQIIYDPTDSEIIASSKTKKYFALTNVNIREGASIEYAKLDLLNFSDDIEVIDYDKRGWSTVVYSDKKIGYVMSKYISKNKPKYKDYAVPNGNSFKAYMSYRTITSRASDQYKLQLNAYTGKYGIRQVNSRFCIAVGTAYGVKIGRSIDVVMANGSVIPCITADVKSNQHTDSTHRQTVADGSIVEFIIDNFALNGNAKFHGNIGYCTENWMGEIAYFRIYE